MLVYIAKAPSTAASFDGTGSVWTKIYQSGLLDASSQKWATDIVNANNGEILLSMSVRQVEPNTPLGKHSVVIPSSLPAGEYLLRAEIVSIELGLCGLRTDGLFS